MNYQKLNTICTEYKLLILEFVNETQDFDLTFLVPDLNNDKWIDVSDDLPKKFDLTDVLNHISGNRMLYIGPKLVGEYGGGEYLPVFNNTIPVSVLDEVGAWLEATNIDGDIEIKILPEKPKKSRTVHSSPISINARGKTLGHTFKFPTEPTGSK